eukprot:g28746.t1
MPKNIPARDEALRALEETQQPLDLLKVVDAELEAADGQSREIFGKTLKKLLREYHPDRCLEDENYNASKITVGDVVG